MQASQSLSVHILEPPMSNSSLPKSMCHSPAVSVHQSISRLLRRLSTLAIRTGSLTVVIEAMILIFFLSSPQSNGMYQFLLLPILGLKFYFCCIRLTAFLVFTYCVGHTYSLTMLYNLNIRKKISHRESMIDAESVALTNDGAFPESG